MYRLVLYVLSGLIVVAMILGLFGAVPYSPLALAYSSAILLIVSWITNELFARVWKTSPNVESVYITALILALIISPPSAGQYLSIAPFLIWTAILSMAVKYILAVYKKHIFNPAAIAVVITAFAIGQSATWWVGTLWMLPFVAIGGLLIARKIRRFDLVLAFLVAALAVIFATSSAPSDVLGILNKAFVDSPIAFFALIMLTEPLTTPPSRKLRIIYGALTGLLFAPAVHIGAVYSTPELALVVGNIFSWIASPKEKYVLTLESAHWIAHNTKDFVFASDMPMRFRPGQYLEWTLGHEKPDSRGNRRYFTVASSPTEKKVHVGVKLFEKSSSFKSSLASLQAGDAIIAGQLSGEFLLPRDPAKKLAFIAGGIGITPYRSMVKYLLDTGDKRDIVLLYSNNYQKEIAYKDVFNAAVYSLNMKWVNTLTDMDAVPTDWKGRTGFVSGAMIKEEIPDYAERMFYISGPHGMVTACKDALLRLGIARKDIMTDYFPGFV